MKVVLDLADGFPPVTVQHFDGAVCEATARTETTLAGEPARAALTATVLRLAERSAA